MKIIIGEKRKLRKIYGKINPPIQRDEFASVKCCGCRGGF